MGNRRVWFDPHLRLWTLQVLDENGDQLGSVAYDYRKINAAMFLTGRKLKSTLEGERDALREMRSLRK